MSVGRPDAGARVAALPDDGVGEAAEQVRAQLARETAQLTPDVVAQALRAQGRPVGDATVLAVLDVLRRDVEGSGPPRFRGHGPVKGCRCRPRRRRRRS